MEGIDQKEKRMGIRTDWEKEKETGGKETGEYNI